MRVYKGKNYGEEKNGNVLWNRGVRGAVPGMGGGASDSEETSRTGDRKRDKGITPEHGFLILV